MVLKKENEELNIENISLLRFVKNSISDGVFILDKEGKCVFVNKKCQEILGIDEEKLLNYEYMKSILDKDLVQKIANDKTDNQYYMSIDDRCICFKNIPYIEDYIYLGKVLLLKDAVDVSTLENKLIKYKGKDYNGEDTRYSFDNIITQDKKMNYLKKIGRKSAKSNSTILITGESGTGKEMFAHAIHEASHRKDGSFVPINCAAIPKELLESELFGYEGGAFTGAKKEGKPGKFEIANGGTVFLDEIGAMPLEMQAKLLRVLEERRFVRVGGTKQVDLDIRVIAATNENLEKNVKEGKFREDLYYRLNVIKLDIPPLRERINDIPLLSRIIISDLSKELGIEQKVLSDESIDIMMRYEWPGNVRELRNILERALNFSIESTIRPKHLPEYLIERASHSIEKEEEALSLKEAVRKAEIEAIKNAIVQSKGNKTLAAEKLGIHRTNLYKKLDKYKIDYDSGNGK